MYMEDRINKVYTKSWIKISDQDMNLTLQYLRSCVDLFIGSLCPGNGTKNNTVHVLNVSIFAPT